MFVSVSASGSSAQQFYENKQEQECLAIWAYGTTLGSSNRNIEMPNDNSAYVSNDVIHWFTNIATAPLLFWNGTAKTNEGYSSVGVSHWFPSGIDNIDANSRLRQDAATNASVIFGTPYIPLWWQTMTNGGFTNIAFFAQGHPVPIQSLEMTLFELYDMGFPTNIWFCHVDAATGTFVTNSCAGINFSGGINGCSWTQKCDRQQFGWDWLDGISTNDASQFVTNMPFLGNLFTCTIQVSNLSTATTYNVKVDGETVWTGVTSAQLSTGMNTFTNYTNPWRHQADAVKYALIDFRGADHTTYITHSAGSKGVLGLNDLVNYQSGAQGAWDAGQRGSTLVATLTPVVADMWSYMHVAYVAAAQTNHNVSITATTAAWPAPFR